MNREHLKTILWLRWRLARNQWTRSKDIGAVMAIIIAVGVVLMGCMTFTAGTLVGTLALAKVSATVLWGVWAGVTAAFLFVWMIGMLVEIQRSETIDIVRLLHLPVSLGQVFVINYVASHLAVSIVIFVPAMLGLAFGLTLSHGAFMLLLFPLVLGMVFMITAWTYCLRGWLATLMSNPRKRRNVIMVITGVVILIGQGPNLYFNVFHRMDTTPKGTTEEQRKLRAEAQKANHQAMLDEALLAQKFIPPFWLPWGAKGLAEQQPLPALAGIAGCMGLGALGLRRAYQSTLKFYRGESGGKAPARPAPSRTSSATPTAPGKMGRLLVEWRPPFVPEQAAALGLATFQSLLRAPEVKMAWGTSILVTLIAGGSMLFRANLKLPEVAKPFVATGAVVFSVFMLVQFFANQFGFDRDGFRALVLSPVDRRLVLMGKNLACLPVGVCFSTLLLALLAVRLHLSPFVLGGAFFQMVALLTLAGIAGNLLSILVPYRIQAGTMKPTKMPALAMLALMGSHLVFPIAMAPVFLPPLAGFLWERAGWPAAGLVDLAFSIVLAGLMGLVYWVTIAPMGRLLERRETQILRVVTTEVE